MSVNRTQLVILAVAAALFPLVYFILAVLCNMTAVFHAELIQRLLMSLGDAREPTMWERLKAGLVWIPAGVIVASFAALYCYALLICARLVGGWSQGKA